MAPGYFITRSDPNDPASTLDFFPPKGSDELHEALKVTYPQFGNLQARMRQAVIDFYVAEQEQAAMDHFSSPTVSDHTSPDYSFNNMTPFTTTEMSFPNTPMISNNTSPDQVNYSISSLPSDMPSLFPQASFTFQPSSAPSPVPEAVVAVPTQEELTTVWALPSRPDAKVHKRRCMTAAEKLAYKQKRVDGACGDCKRRRRKSKHNSGSSTPSSSVSSSVAMKSVARVPAQKPPISTNMGFNADFPMNFEMPHIAKDFSTHIQYEEPLGQFDFTVDGLFAEEEFTTFQHEIMQPFEMDQDNQSFTNMNFIQNIDRNQHSDSRHSSVLERSDSNSTSPTSSFSSDIQVIRTNGSSQLDSTAIGRRKGAGASARSVSGLYQSNVQHVSANDMGMLTDSSQSTSRSNSVRSGRLKNDQRPVPSEPGPLQSRQVRLQSVPQSLQSVPGTMQPVLGSLHVGAQQSLQSVPGTTQPVPGSLHVGAQKSLQSTPDTTQPVPGSLQSKTRQLASSNGDNRQQTNSRSSANQKADIGDGMKAQSNPGPEHHIAKLQPKPARKQFVEKTNSAISSKLCAVFPSGVTTSSSDHLTCSHAKSSATQARSAPMSAGFADICWSSSSLFVEESCKIAESIAIAHSQVQNAILQTIWSIFSAAKPLVKAAARSSDKAGSEREGFTAENMLHTVCRFSLTANSQPLVAMV